MIRVKVMVGVMVRVVYDIIIGFSLEYNNLINLI